MMEKREEEEGEDKKEKAGRDVTGKIEAVLGKGR